MKKIILLAVYIIFSVSGPVAGKDYPIIKNSRAKITIGASDAELQKVLELFSEQSNINFIAGEEVKDKKVTVFLDDVILQDALTALIEANALNYKQIGESKLFIVRSRDFLRPQTITRIFTLKYIDLSGEVERGGLEGETEQSTSRGRSTGGTTGAGAAEEVQYADIYYVIEGLLSEYMTSDGQIVKHGKIKADLRSNSLIVTDVPENIWKIENAIRELDQKLPQVMIEIQMVEVASSVLKKLGIEWGGATGEILAYTGPSKGTGFPLSSKDGELTVGVLSMQQFTAVLNMLSTRGKARFLARPKVLTTNLKSAKIELTANKAIGVETVAGQETGLTTQTAERMETGISLEVKPQISPEGMITMMIKPEVSRVSASEYFPGQFVDPQKRSIETTVVVRDGETVTIGGLLSDIDERTENKVPVFGDIPFLGNLFKDRGLTVTNTELLIFITPHLVKEEEMGVIK